MIFEFLGEDTEESEWFQIDKQKVGVTQDLRVINESGNPITGTEKEIERILWHIEDYKTVRCEFKGLKIS